MDEESQDRPVPAELRHRSQSFLGYLFWVMLALVLLWAANLCAQLIGQWVSFLRGIRAAAGIPAPAHGVDYWMIGGVGGLGAALLVVLGIVYLVYRAAWNRRLAAVWGTSGPPRAGKRSRKGQFTYLDRLAASPGWSSAGFARRDDSREGYCQISESILKRVEIDIAARSVTTGLIVGMNRNPLLDTLTIVAAAFELQLHVLTVLGAKPSLRVWIQLLKRAGASVFLNTYIGRDDALYLNLTIRKAALGIEMASDTVQEAAGALAISIGMKCWAELQFRACRL